jgi:hypothetical protein
MSSLVDVRSAQSAERPAFPGLESYLERLPRGLDSYPEVCVKGAFVRRMLGQAPRPLREGMGLPPVLEQLVVRMPGPNDWVPVAHQCGLALCVYDLNFANNGGLAAYGAWTIEVQRRLLGSALYRILFAVMSPERLLVGATHRWSAFNRGMNLEAITSSNGRGAFRLKRPPHLLPALSLVGYGASFRAGLELCGAMDIVVQRHDESPSSTLYEYQWR